ncbi:MAG: BrnT family toxin [Gemmatimonadetes bacterium]|nr:BrnT family toxin [Gemmatimonadota bacterium]MBL0178591.1 BrnT family toxin [Gemmatimonadota bacterium]
MQFIWDEAKSERTYRERGFDFAFATLIFEGPTLEREDTRQDYGERRMLAIGMAQGVELTVCYTDRVTTTGSMIRRIVSARRSQYRERKAYHQAFEGR